MEALCTSFWFWLVVIGSGCLALVAAWLNGYAVGRSAGKTMADINWSSRIRRLHKDYEGRFDSGAN